MRKLVSIVLLLATCITMWAVPAVRQPILRSLENGKTDTIYLYGDEYASYRTSARTARVPSLRAQAPQQQKIASYVPTTGKVRVPVILVNFTDLSFTIDNPQAQFNDLFNINGGSNPNATGSVHTYFDASSNGALDLDYEVFGPYTLSHEMAYYGANRTSGGVTTNHNIRASELVTEAVQLAYDNGVDFSSFDANNDGTVDNISIVVAGYNEAEGGPANSIWPHYSNINTTKRYGTKYISGYLMISEYRGSGGKVQAGIGTYCHEFGHALGLPDLYDTSSSDAYTVGDWDVMCSGCYNNSGSTPPTYTAFERFVMGWLTPEQVTTAGIKTLQPIETSNEALLIAASTHNLNALSPNPAEYFLMENRQALGWDAGRDALVATGMLVTHITFNSSTWAWNTFNNSKPLGFAIVSAGVTVQIESTAADVFPGSTRRTTWQPTLNDGTVLNEHVISQIRQRTDGSISMYIGEGEDMLSFVPEEIEVSTLFLNEPLAYDTAVTTLRIPSTQQDSLLIHMESGLFKYSLDSGAQWYGAGDTAIIQLAHDSAYSMPLMIIHTPKKQRCAYSYAYLTAQTPDESMATQLTLKGNSPRPTLITPPVIDSIAEVSTHSFTVYWEEQNEADGYFYTLYTISAGSSTETEDFENFATLAEIRESGWNANFANTQSSVSKSGSAVLFTSSEQYLQTPKYLYTPTQLSFWLSNNYTPNGTDKTQGGQLYISGSEDGVTWKVITKITIQRTTKNIVRTIDLDTTQHMRIFRITYAHLGGNGGTIIDTWSAHYPVALQYIYAPHKNMVYSGNNSIRFRDLQPATEYYYTMQTYDEKGCEPHYSDFSSPVLIRTKATAEDQQLVVKRVGSGQYIIVLPEMSNGTETLAVYDNIGHLIQTIYPSYGTTTITLPTLDLGQLYLVKYYIEKMKRKDLNAKILCY